jgi:hypothetical protein
MGLFAGWRGRRRCGLAALRCRRLPGGLHLLGLHLLSGLLAHKSGGVRRLPSHTKKINSKDCGQIHIPIPGLLGSSSNLTPSNAEKLLSKDYKTTGFG